MRNGAALAQKGFVAASVTAVVVYVILYVSSQHRQGLETLDRVISDRFRYFYRAVQSHNSSLAPEPNRPASKTLDNWKDTDGKLNTTRLRKTAVKLTSSESEVTHGQAGNVKGSVTRIERVGSPRYIKTNISRHFNSSFSTHATDRYTFMGHPSTIDYRTTKAKPQQAKQSVQQNKTDRSRQAKLSQYPKMTSGSVHADAKDEAFRRTVILPSNQQETARKQTIKHTNASSSANGSLAAKSSPVGQRVTAKNDHSSNSSSKNHSNSISDTTAHTPVKASAGVLDPGYSDPCEGVADNETLALTSGSARAVRPRYLIYKCDVTHGYCGGWSDRQRGMVSVFLLALATCRRFAVVMTTPCPITHFLQPHRVNWTVAKALTRDRPWLFLNDVTDRQNLTRRLQWMDFNKEYPQDVVYLRTNSPFYLSSLLSHPGYRHRLPDWTRQSDAKVFSTVWRMLVQPTVDIQTSVDSYLNEVRGGANATGNPGSQRSLVCAHVRMGKSETIQNDAVRTDPRDLPALMDFLQPYVNNGSQIFLATDSYQVRNLTRQRFGASVRHMGGPIVHVDRQARQPDACDGFRAALLDQLILQQCDVLVITHSGFGLRAAYLRGRGDNLFIFSDGKVRPQTLT